MLQRLLCLLVGYLCGCFLTAELVARARTGKSAAALGTGNPGMANLAHELGKGWGAVVIPALFVPPAFLCCGREAGLLALILALVMLSRHIRGLGRILRGEEERKFRSR